MVLFFSLLIFNSVIAQNNFEFISPDSEVNQSTKGKSLEQIDLIRYEINEEGMTLDPRLPSDWHWVAGRNLKNEYGRIDFFFWNGLLFTNSVDVKYVSYRIRKMPDLFTDKIESNTFVIGFQKEDKGILFAATEEPKEVYIKLDKEIMGREMVYNFHLGKNEAKMFRITRKYQPFLP